MVVYKIISTARPLATGLSIIVKEDKDHADARLLLILLLPLLPFVRRGKLLGLIVNFVSFFRGRGQRSGMDTHYRLPVVTLYRDQGFSSTQSMNVMANLKDTLPLPFAVFVILRGSVTPYYDHSTIDIRTPPNGSI
jgi:hypothetical protein